VLSPKGPHKLVLKVSINLSAERNPNPKDKKKKKRGRKNKAKQLNITGFDQPHAYTCDSLPGGDPTGGLQNDLC
jgi:hypothetical protein